MSLTRREAINEILGLFKTAWEVTAGLSGGRVKYDNVGNASTVPSGHNAWARVKLRHTKAGQASLSGAHGTQRFERIGILTIQIFQAPGKGLSGAADLPIIIMKVYEGKATLGGVWFRDVVVNEIGVDGGFYQTNVVAFFEYDEIR